MDGGSFKTSFYLDVFPQIDTFAGKTIYRSPCCLNGRILQFGTRKVPTFRNIGLLARHVSYPLCAGKVVVLPYRQ